MRNAKQKSIKSPGAHRVIYFAGQSRIVLGGSGYSWPNTKNLQSSRLGRDNATKRPNRDARDRNEYFDLFARGLAYRAGN